MATKKRGQERLEKLRRHCERYDLTDCFEFYAKKLLRKYKTNDITFKKLEREVFSDYLLLKKSDDGICTCITCGTKREWYLPNMHPGHYRKQGDSAFLKYVEDNVRPQCGQCNVYYGGQVGKYTMFMLSKFKEKYVQWLLECKETLDMKLGEAEENTLVRWRRLNEQQHFIIYKSQCLSKK